MKTFCPECGFNVSVDEDGCCILCGATATGSAVNSLFDSTMRTKQEILENIEKCSKVASFGISNGPCPFNDDGLEGCCAECSTMSTLQWVLKSSKSPNRNAQNIMIEKLTEKN